MKYARFSYEEPTSCTGRSHYCYYWTKDDKSDARPSPVFDFRQDLTKWVERNIPKATQVYL